MISFFLLKFRNLNSLSGYKFLIGAHNVTKLGFEPNAVRASLAKLIIHESYVRDNFDIALVKFDVRIKFALKINKLIAFLNKNILRDHLI